MKHQETHCFFRLAASQWVAAMLHDSWMKHVNVRASSEDLTRTHCDIPLLHT
jgi:hypothetical protein